jgi:hypothetical protein
MATNSGTPSVLASTDQATTTTSTTTKTPTKPNARRFFSGGGPMGLLGGRIGMFALGELGGFGPGGDGMVHGSFTIKGPNGYETVDVQSGTAQAVSSSSITVKSADGFSQTYNVGSSTVVDADYDGIQSVKVGDDISVQALTSGSTVTAERVTDLTQLQANRKSWVPSGTGPSATNGREWGPMGGWSTSTPHRTTSHSLVPVA